MALSQKLGTSTILFTFVLALFSLAAASPGRAQDTPPPPETPFFATNDLSSDAASVPGANDEVTVADSSPQTTGTTSSQASAQDNQWHIIATPYVWFPAIYGTVGFPNRTAEVHASAGDALSHFRFGLMGTVDFRWKWLVMPLDVVWARLGGDKYAPVETGSAESANIKAGEFILTPQIGARLLDQKKLKIDFLTGFRYWHFMTSVAFSPDTTKNFTEHLNWVDPLVGGRIQAALSPKILVNILGDVGGWGTGSLIDYQVGGVLGYKVKPNIALLAGYRYMRVAYRAGPFLMNLHFPGVVFGATIDLR